MVFSRMILGFIISKERKLLNPKKIQTILNMPPPKIPNKLKYSMGVVL
jgi:chemotaxis signal transduction protein